MLYNESLWYRKVLDRYIQSSDVVFNIGSSTHYFRSQVQPHIFANVLSPLEQKGAHVFHIDMKVDEGVDLVGDLTDPNFLDELMDFKPTSIICSNLLEHLLERSPLCHAITRLLPVNGKVFVSVPHEYPYHSDPVDTMFRPNVAQLVAEFPGMELVDGEVVDCGSWGALMQSTRERYPNKWHAQRRNRLIKMFLPFYKPKEWWRSITGKDRFRPNQRISATCVVLCKPGNDYA